MKSPMDRLARVRAVLHEQAKAEVQRQQAALDEAHGALGRLEHARLDLLQHEGTPIPAVLLNEEATDATRRHAARVERTRDTRRAEANQRRLELRQAEKLVEHERVRFRRDEAHREQRSLDEIASRRGTKP